MVDIIVDKDAFIESQVHPLMIEQAIQIMKDNPYPTRPKAKGKWQEIVILDSNDRLAMNCHKEHDKIVITGIKKLRKKKPLGPPRR